MRTWIVLLFFVTGCTSGVDARRGPGSVAVPSLPDTSSDSAVTAVVETFGEWVRRWGACWRSARTAAERRDVVIGVIDSGTLCHYRRLDDIDRIFGADLEPYRLSEDGSGQHIVHCVPLAGRDIGGWEVGHWYLVVEHTHRWYGVDRPEQRVSDYWLSTHSEKDSGS